MIRLRTLGRVELEGLDRALADYVLRGPKRLALLVYLATVTPRGFERRDVVASLLWPELDQERARHSLRNSLHELRAALGAGVIGTRGTEEVDISESVLWCDAVALEKALAEGRAEEVIALYRGAFLEGFHVPGCAAEFERWIQTHRERLDRDYAKALEMLAEARESAGDFLGAAELWGRLSALDPFGDRVTIRLLRALEAGGERGQALRHAEAHAALLRDELGVEPEPEVTALAQSLRESHARGRESDREAPIDGDHRTATATGPFLTSAPGASAQVEATASPATPQVDPRAPEKERRRPARLATLAVGLAVGLLGLYLIPRNDDQGPGRVQGSATDRASSIAILPFTIRGDGLEVWREGMVDLVSTNLDGVAGLRAIDSRTVLARWREGVSGSETPDLETALEVAHRTGARYALLGSAVVGGPGVRFTAEVYEVTNGRMLGTSQVEGPVDSVFGLVDRLTIETLRALERGEGPELAPINLARTTTTSLPALKAYLEGEKLFRRSDFPEAAAAYQQAVQADSTFSLALARLSLSEGWAGSTSGDSTAITRAARFADRLPGREAALVHGGLAYTRGTLDGIAGLREAVDTYPDDAEAWYLLGETYQHLGAQACIGRDEADLAFEKAVEQDPSFTPAYLHLIDNAFAWGDSARTGRLLETYARLAPESPHVARNQLAFELVFGDSAARSRARAEALELQTVNELMGVSVALSNVRTARALSLREELVGAARRLGNVSPLATANLFRANYGRGQIRAALERLDDPLASEGLKIEGLYSLDASRTPVERERVEEALALDRVDSTDVFQNFYAGAYAADRARWGDHAIALSRLREAAAGSSARADTTAAEFAEGAASGLEGYGWWRRGQNERALELLTQAQRSAVGYHEREDLNAHLRWWLGQLLTDMERPEDALRYFESFEWSQIAPIAAYERAQLHEQLGEMAQAREAWMLVAAEWKDADPELQSRVEEARAAVQRLTSVMNE